MKYVLYALLSIAALQATSLLEARYVCCIDEVDDVMCKGFNDKATCNKSCPSECQHIADNDSGEALD